MATIQTPGIDELDVHSADIRGRDVGLAEGVVALRLVHPEPAEGVELLLERPQVLERALAFQVWFGAVLLVFQHHVVDVQLATNEHPHSDGVRVCAALQQKEGNVLFNDALNTFYLRFFMASDMGVGGVLYVQTLVKNYTYHRCLFVLLLHYYYYYYY